MRPSHSLAGFWLDDSEEKLRRKAYANVVLCMFFLEAFPLSFNQKPANMRVARTHDGPLYAVTHRLCVMCVDARRYGCTAEILAYTTH